LGRETDKRVANQKGIELAQSEIARHPENARAAYLGASALASLGEAARAREWAWRALAIDPDDPLTQYNVACAYAKLGDIDAAFDLLERLLPHANHETKAWVKHDSDFAPLHDHPRWQRVLALTK
jgi:adenylate cyclase